MTNVDTAEIYRLQEECIYYRNRAQSAELEVKGLQSTIETLNLRITNLQNAISRQDEAFHKVELDALHVRARFEAQLHLVRQARKSTKGHGNG